MFIIIPGQLIALLTFPGVILHEISHRIFCDVNNVPVYQISYFKIFSKEAGYVIHEKPKTYLQALSIALAPVIINSLMCILLTFPIGSTIFMETYFVGFSSYFISGVYYFMAWIGLSAGLNAFSSNQDIQMLFKLSTTKTTELISEILKMIFFILNSSVLGFGFSLVYSGILATALPYYLFG